MKDLRASTVIAALALFIAIGGTATAASGLINGGKIKPGTVTAKQIKNKTITAAKLSPATVSSLRGADGAAGATGATGPAGVKGATGATGASGVVVPRAVQTVDYSLASGEQATPLQMEVPTGTYLITAKLNAISHKSSGLNLIDCAIWTDETTGVDTGQADGAFNETLNLAMTALASVQSKIELRCTAQEGPAFTDDLKLIAVPVQS